MVQKYISILVSVVTSGMSVKCAHRTLNNLQNAIFTALITFWAGLLIYPGNGLIFHLRMPLKEATRL